MCSRKTRLLYTAHFSYIELNSFRSRSFSIMLDNSIQSSGYFNLNDTLLNNHLRFNNIKHLLFFFSTGNDIFVHFIRIFKMIHPKCSTNITWTIINFPTPFTFTRIFSTDDITSLFIDTLYSLRNNRCSLLVYSVWHA